VTGYAPAEERSCLDWPRDLGKPLADVNGPGLRQHAGGLPRPAVLVALAPEAIVIYGVVTDFCDRYSVEGLLRHSPAAKLFLVTGCHPDDMIPTRARLLAEWEARGVHLVAAADVLSGRAFVRHQTFV